MATQDPITIGADCGGPEAIRVAESKVRLYKAFSKFVKSTHCDAIDQYALLLLVDGTLDKFGPEGIFKLRFAKARRYIAVDIQIPQSRWEPMSEWQLREYLAEQCMAAIKACVSRLKKERIAVEECALWSEVEQAIQAYIAEAQS
jgi:hypothetical protein